MKYAEVLLPQKISEDFETLTYSIPEEITAQSGQSVKVLLRNKPHIGIIINIHEEKPKFKTFSIKEILEEKPLLNELQLKTLKWMSKYYFCPKFKILKLFIPKRNLARKPFRKRKTEDSDQKNESKKKELTKMQAETVKTILKDTASNKFLIHGITGSGKTEIYTNLSKNYIDQGKQVLMLVPEISLTPQMIEYFENTLKVKTAVIHSKLSEGERFKAWEDIWKNEAKLIIGSRSSIFAPFQDLGLIIIDEEHENSYKQDKAPRYSVHQIAEKFQEINPKIKVVLGSATPSVSSTELYKESTSFLHERIGDSTLPEVEIVDLRDEFKKKNYSIFSDKLKEELAKVLEKKEQAILFLNRRGSASSVVCRDCGHIEKCAACEIPLTYHSKTLGRPSLICHHCGLITSPPDNCPECKGHNIRFLGIGTQRIEEDLLKEFPGVKVLRADRDTTSTKHGFEDIYQSFKKHEADVLVGTQMIAKGLHLPKVNLVGIVLADIGINIPD
ncbi:primosomal protein N', partial [Candidatus Peregrinibacteria bacterium]|nr:primosomal protein N' [Candidatus Peregrinibacteria bacterium]